LLAKEGFKFDVAFTSYLKRAIRTLWHVMEQTDTMYIPIHNSYMLNERYVTHLQYTFKNISADGVAEERKWNRR
jgi:2,3-bisphosphoglycerate-dependent phosphoglycerate mutase